MADDLTYHQFLGESHDVAIAYEETNGRRPSSTDFYHNAWKRAVEGRPHEEVIGLIRGTWPEEPTPVPTPEPSLVLPVISGNRFLRFVHDPTLVYDWREVSGFGLYHLSLADRYEDLHAWLRSIKLYANSVRVMLAVEGGPGDFWGDYATSWKNPLFYARLVEFAQILDSHGMRMHACLIGATDSFGAIPNWDTREDVVTVNHDAQQRMREYVSQTVGTLTDHVGTGIIQIANEPHQIGFGTHNEEFLAELAGIAHAIAPKIPISLGDGGEWDGQGDLPMSTAPSNIHGHHPLRMRERDYHRAITRRIHHFNIDQGDMPVMLDEDLNMGDQLSGASGSASTAVAFAAAVMGRIKRLAGGHFHMREGLKPMHHSNGVGVDDPINQQTTNALNAWNHGLNLVPMEIEGEDCNADSCGSAGPVDRGQVPPTEKLEGHDGPIRVFGLRDTNLGGYWGLSIGEPIGYRLRGDFETVHLEQWGGWQSRFIRA